MITMRFQNNSESTLVNPVAHYDSPFQTILHAPGSTLGHMAGDYLQVEQAHFGSILDLGELPLQAYRLPGLDEMFVLMATGPQKIVGFSWDDPSWQYWIGPGDWPAPGQPGWVVGSSATVDFLWGPLMVSVAPTLGDDITINVSFDTPRTRGSD